MSSWQQLAAVILAVTAVTLGCSAENVAESLASGNSTASASSTASTDGFPTGAVDTTSVLITPLTTSSSGKATGRGTADDVVSVNRAADAVFGALAAGALEAADDEGGAIDDPDFIATGTTGTLGQGLRTSSFLIPHSVATLQEADPGNVSATGEGTGVRLRSAAGIDVQVSGVKASVETTGTRPPIDGFSLAGQFRLLGTLGVGTRPEVDLRVAGLSGAFGRTLDGLNAIDLGVVLPGVTVQGVLMGARVDATFSGLNGRFTDVRRLNTRLATDPVRLHVASLVARDAVDALSADLVVSDLALPTRAGEPVRYFVSGVLNATLSKKHPLARTGRVARVTVDIPARNAFEMSGLEGPFSGAADVTLISPDGKTRDRLTHAYRGDSVSIAGTRTNASGEAERVTSAGDMRRAAGGVRFKDGSRQEHILDVRRTRVGRRITFQFIAKDARGVQQLIGDAVVHADRGLTGRWTRPAPGGADGTFQVNPDGELELIGRDGDLLARTKLREGWNDLLF